MKVSAWNNGQNTYGISVGTPNRDKYFSPQWKIIEVEIDGQFYTFGLTDGFWNNCPEFRDKGKPIIRDWLAQHNMLIWPYREPPEFDLVPLGGGKFCLEL